MKRRFILKIVGVSTLGALTMGLGSYAFFDVGDGMTLAQKKVVGDKQIGPSIKFAVGAGGAIVLTAIRERNFSKTAYGQVEIESYLVDERELESFIELSSKWN